VADDQSHDRPIAFGPFRLTPKARLLEKEGAALHIGGRALDILMFLAARPGEVVDKRELMKQVWANVHVDEGSLRFHVTVLRKALGDTNGAQYIKNVPGRGYCFVARPVCSEASAAPPSASTASPGPLPSQIARLIGRAEAVEKISADIMLHRVVTIVGPWRHGQDLSRRRSGASPIHRISWTDFFYRFQWIDGCQPCPEHHRFRAGINCQLARSDARRACLLARKTRAFDLG
jgi:DNA-binding winged helix-turn-helix (wHTH) protein